MAGETNYTDPTKGSKLNDGNSKAMKYLEQLLDEGHNEGISEAELHLPSWFDANLFKEGQDTIKSYRLYMSVGFLAGFIASMSIPSILKILSCTGQSGTERKAYRRYIATIMHTMVWYTEPLDQRSQLWQSILLVRKAHFRSSDSCLQKQMGRITQRDLVITQFCLIGFTMLGAEEIGLNDERFMESNTYMWRVLGYLLGIKDEYNVCAESWGETKPRFELLLKRVLQPALTTVGPEFHEMTAVLLEGLRPVHSVLTVDSTLFYIKRLAGCKGYAVLDRDFLGEDPQAIRDRRRYYSLKLWDRLIVATAVMMFTYLYRISAIRWYLNAFAQLSMWILTYFPYLAIYKYGWSWAYVRLFGEPKKNKTI